MGDSKAPFWVRPVTLLIRSLRLPDGWDGLGGPIAERLREILPSDEFEVEVDGATVRVRSLGWPGAVLTGLAIVPLRLPLPISLRLRLFFENEADALQDFVSTVQGETWPAPGAKPHARVTDELVNVWYGTGNEASAVLRWRPFTRSELGL